MKKNNQYVAFDGDIIPADEPVVPVMSRGLMYGDGVFETFRTYSSNTFLLDEHLNRLFAGLNAIGIQSPKALQNKALKPLLLSLLQKNNLKSTGAIIRLQVWRGGGRGYQPKRNIQTHFSVTVSSCPNSFMPPDLTTVEHCRIPSQSLPQVKFTNSINYILAAREAFQKGADDALMQTVDNRIAETTMANIFWCKGSTIFTPDIDCDLLPGITRNIILKLTKKQPGFEVEEGKYHLNDLLEADAVWICNSVREVLPVQSVDGKAFDVGHPVVKTLQKLYTEFRLANTKSLK